MHLHSTLWPLLFLSMNSTVYGLLWQISKAKIRLCICAVFTVKITFVHTESPFMHDTTQLRTGLIGICCECVGLYLELNHYFLNPQFHEILELEANWLHLKAPYSSKIDIFHPLIIYINKYIHGINTIIKCGIWQPVKFQLISWFWTGYKWNDVLLYFWMLATWIQRYDKNHFIFDPVQERETNWNFTVYPVPHFMIVLIPYIYLLNLSWIIKCLFFRNMESLIY